MILPLHALCCTAAGGVSSKPVAQTVFRWNCMFVCALKHAQRHEEVRTLPSTYCSCMLVCMQLLLRNCSSPAPSEAEEPHPGCFGNSSVLTSPVNCLHRVLIDCPCPRGL